ncbi:MAG: trigger factor family protein, partial [Coriobacteriales bacterium]
MEETLDIQTSKLEDGKVQITVTVPAQTVKQHIDRHFKDLGRARIPGFRPGKAPRKILEQNFGGHEA